ncbi:manganese/iron ABC transporter ATP-binding protein [Photobacterium leiognathi]|uniref:manganese/iron ABC transporter ATP-binding protein n=1 Tax=Photobacterium leiognathi TaxID=553611 RepID=UPI0029819D67|nr:manganese/iron ABC transporter ATP-binding protein [Photobacterium leiognathi]
MLGLNINDITVTYRNGHTALHDASFSIPQGSITALVGINGSGKSTLFKAIMGFVPTSKGKVEILNHSVKQALKKNMVAYVPQSEEIDWNFPVLVKDVVMMGRYGYMNMLRIPRKIDHENVNAALERVNMQHFSHRQIGELSGGQRKRVFLARALAQESQVILLDEPFTGVDVQTEEQIMALLRELRNEGKVMLVSTHNLGSIPDFCDRTVLINKTILASEETSEIFTPENLKIAFGGVLRHFILAGKDLHEDDDKRQLSVISDHERPVVMYGENGEQQSQSLARHHQ